jgi:hypothetical protein
MELSGLSVLLEKLLNKYGLAFLVLWCGAGILREPGQHWFPTLYGIMFMHWWVYWVHRGLHVVPRDGLIGFLNTHWRWHHQTVKTLDRRVELFFEAIADLGMSFLLLLIQWAIGIYIIPVSSIFIFAVSYTSIHLINYSIIGSKSHRLHHTELEKNFGPDAIDHMHGTNYDDEYEDMDPIALNTIATTALLYPLKQYFG